MLKEKIVLEKAYTDDSSYILLPLADKNLIDILLEKQTEQKDRNALISTQYTTTLTDTTSVQGTTWATLKTTAMPNPATFVTTTAYTNLSMISQELCSALIAE